MFIMSCSVNCFSCGACSIVKKLGLRLYKICYADPYSSRYLFTNDQWDSVQNNKAVSSSIKSETQNSMPVKWAGFKTPIAINFNQTINLRFFIAFISHIVSKHIKQCGKMPGGHILFCNY